MFILFCTMVIRLIKGVCTWASERLNHMTTAVNSLFVSHLCRLNHVTTAVNIIDARVKKENRSN